MSLPLLASLTGLGLGVMAWVCGDAVKRWPALCSAVPRQRLLGGLLGVVVLSWAAYHGCAMLEDGLSRYRTLVKLAVPVVAVLGFLHLDYLLSRSLGGITLLVVNELLHAGFAEHVALRPVFSTVCYALGLCGLLLVGAPWRLRDLLERSRDSQRWRLGAASALVGSALVLVILSVVPS